MPVFLPKCSKQTKTTNIEQSLVAGAQRARSLTIFISDQTK